MSDNKRIEIPIQINFTDDKPSNEGLYLYRKDKRFTRYDTWELVEVYYKKPRFWVRDKKMKGCAYGVDSCRGQFSKEFFNIKWGDE